MSTHVQLRRDRRSPARDLRGFLPTTREEMSARGWDELDVLLVTGDAYVDHPSFGMSIIGRALEAKGFRVGIVAQPRWAGPEALEDLTVMGRPRLFVGVTAGNMDSMLNRLTAQKKLRSEDQYSPNGEVGKRPNRATIVYSNLCRQAFPGLPVVAGGIEASLRRIVHYDYWEDQVRRSIVLDSKADLVIFGMGERPVVEVAARLKNGASIREVRGVRGTAYALRKGEWEALAKDPSRYVKDQKVVVLPAWEELKDTLVAGPAGQEAKQKFAEMSRLFQYETNPGNARPLLQIHGNEAVYLEPPADPLVESEMDALYDAPYARRPHWSYGDAKIPAFDTIKHSVVTMRGCFGGCTFCSITEHEGRAIQSRSEDSILREVRAMQRMSDAIGFKGVLSDLGGPTANMYKMTCKSDDIEKACRKLSCVHPGICENLVTDHGPLISLLKRVREEPGVKKVMVASGVRYDLADQGKKGSEFISELARHHTGGQLSVAPEHNEDKVLMKMKKPGIASYERFASKFECASQEAGKEQYLVPYFISGHPGSSVEDMISLALWLKARNMRPRQVQDFIPTPMSMATCMHVTGIDPLTMTPVHTVTDLREKKLQKALLFYWDEQHHDMAREALRKAKRQDLIGTGPRALVPPARAHTAAARSPNREALRGRR